MISIGVFFVAMALTQHVHSFQPSPAFITRHHTTVFNKNIIGEDLDWNDEHVAHNINEVHEETDNEVLDSEIAAAWDAHDCNDPGMEAVAEERAVMIANELIHKKKEQQQQQQRREGAQQQQDLSWNDQHLVHSVEELHLETSKEMFESENSAAWDAHDCNDPGMESAAEERAVMLANEMMEKLVKKEKNQKEKTKK